MTFSLISPPAIINNTSSVICLSKHAPGAKPDDGLSHVLQSGEVLINLSAQPLTTPLDHNVTCKKILIALGDRDGYNVVVSVCCITFGEGGLMSEKEILNYQIALQKTIHSRLLKSGYADIETFFNDSGVSNHLTAIAANRCFHDRIKPVHPLSMALVMKFLDFSHSEILKAIDKLGGAKYIILFEDPDTRRLEDWEEGLLGAVRKIKDQPHVLEDVVDFLINITKMHNVNAASDIARIRVPKRFILAKSGDNTTRPRLGDRRLE